MIDRTPTQPVVPDFTPVPRKRRHDGWTPERQKAFIEALAELGSVKHAAARINMSVEGAYYLRRSPGADSFIRAWDAALDHGVQRLADIAIDRAMEGVPVPVFWRGEQVGERRWHDNRLLMFVLRHHLPNRYGPLAVLKPGTRHPDTVAREEAQLRRTEEWVQHRGEDLVLLLRMHREKVYASAEAHIAGDTEAFDALKTQAEALESAIDGDPSLWRVWAGLKAAEDGKNLKEFLGEAKGAK